MANLVPAEVIENKIFVIRGQKVMLDVDLARLYGVKTFVLNQAVKRNEKRFPKDFMFQLSKQEFKNLKSHFVMSRWGGRRTKPYVFTEQGIAMLSSILKSERAIIVNIAIMRAFVRFRQILLTHKELELKVNELEQKYGKHDEEVGVVFRVIKKMLIKPERPKMSKIRFV